MQWKQKLAHPGLAKESWPPRSMFVSVALHASEQSPQNNNALDQTFLDYFKK